MGDLRLPKLPDRTPVKITFTASAELHRDLQDYAEAYAASYGAAEPIPELVPYMLASFMMGDPSFKKLKMGK